MCHGKNAHRLLEGALVGATAWRAVDEVGRVAGIGDEGLRDSLDAVLRDATLDIALNIDVGSGKCHSDEGECKKRGGELHDS